MRVGMNPLKHKAVLPPYKRHRIIMPVYIPAGHEYFQSAVDIFRMCFASLLATIDREHVSITIIDNASIPEVGEELQRAFAAGHIDRLVRNAVNRGKPDAVASEILASYEQYVTMADCDVLFLPGWLARVEEIFATWPEAGAVSPASQPNTAYHYSGATWMYAALRGKVKLGKYVSDEDLAQFARSIGREDFYSPRDINRQFAVCRDNVSALLGATHFVITLRRACYDGFVYKPRLEGTGHGMRAIDRQVDAQGWLRLSTTKAHALHMGNTPEPWMADKLNAVLAAPVERLRASGSEVDRAVRKPANWMPAVARRGVSKGIQLAARAIHKYS